MKNKQKLKEIKDNNIELKEDNFTIKKNLLELKLLVIRNNINFNLLANRDTLKTILFLFAYELNIPVFEELKEKDNLLIYNKKLTKLVLNILYKLNSSKKPVFLRSGFGNNQL